MIKLINRAGLHFPVAVLAYLFILTCSLPAASPTTNTVQPDFTKGHTIPDGYSHDWNLGPTGARGWIYSYRMETSRARQIRITKIDAGSPVDGILRVGDVILGVDGKAFDNDPRVLFGKAISKAEISGELNLLRWRDGTTKRVVIILPVLGGYSPTAPWNCPKSEKVLKQGLRALATRIADPEYRSVPITRSLNALALLASGGDKYLPLVKKEAEWASSFTSNGYKLGTTVISLPFWPSTYWQQMTKLCYRGYEDCRWSPLKDRVLLDHGGIASFRRADGLAATG